MYRLCIHQPMVVAKEIERYNLPAWSHVGWCGIA